MHHRLAAMMLAASESTGGGGDPSSIAGLLGWWKADTGITKDGSDFVSQWDDQSGNGKHLTQATSGNRPTWEASIKNGLPGVKFPTSRGLIFPSGLAGIQSILCVFTYPTATFSTNSIIVSRTYSPNAWFGSSGTAQWSQIPFDLYRRNGSVRANNETISPLNASHYVVGYSGLLLPMDMSSQVMGNWPLLYDNAWTGHIHEFAIWDAQLSGSEITTVENYVTGKWGSF